MALTIFWILVFSGCSSAAKTGIRIPEGRYTPFFDLEKKPVEVSAYELDVTPVTQGNFLDFIQANPEWRRSAVKRLFADEDYLKNWRTDEAVPQAEAPVTYVSWFAAKAYCAWRGGRLPTLDEWEYAATARLEGETDSADQNRKILEWYGRPSSDRLPSVKGLSRNAYGIAGLHGVVWEWVYDFNALPASDGRPSSTPLSADLFCAGGAELSGDPENYAAYMRYAFRSSLKGRYTVKNLGFRCAYDS